MEHTSYLFDFQDIIQDIRDKIKEGKELYCEHLLDTIDEDTEFEDLPVYKEYLSIFDVEHDLGGLELLFPSALNDCKADSLSVLRLVAASFSSTYDLEYDDETNSVILIISSESHGESRTAKLPDLWSFQIRRLFEIYIEEQLNLEALRLNSEAEKKAIEEERKVKLMVFQKKIRQLGKQIEKKERIHESQKESSDILSDMDDLLNS